MGFEIFIVDDIEMVIGLNSLSSQVFGLLSLCCFR